MNVKCAGWRVLSDPPAFAPKIQYFTHEHTFKQIAPFFTGLKKEDLPDGEGRAVESAASRTRSAAPRPAGRAAAIFDDALMAGA